VTQRNMLPSENETLLAIGVNEGEPSIYQLIQIATAGVGLDILLRRCTTISTSLLNAEDQAIAGPEFWLDIAKSIFEWQLPEEIENGLRLGWRVTNATQLANLALYAVSLRTFKGIAQPKSFLRLLGLFNYAVLKDPMSDRFYIEPDSVAGGFAVTTSHRTRFMNVTDRYLAFVEWSDAQPGTSVRALVQEAFGMSLEDHIRCSETLQAYFDPPHVGINGVAPLNRHAINNPILLRWLDARSYTVEEVDAELGEDPLRALRNRGHYLVLAKPFVRLGDLHYLLNHRSLENSLGLGVFFAAMDANTNRVGGDKEARANAAREFGGIAGRYYEQYAGERVRRIAKRSGSYFHPEVKDGAFRSIDFFVLENDHLVLFEMHHGRVRRDVVESLNPEGIEKAFEQLVYAKIEQLDCTVRALADGRLRVPGVDLDRVSRLYPVVCLPASFPRSPAIQEKMNTHLATRKWLPQRCGSFEVAPFEIIEAEALEGLDGIQEAVLFSKLIDEKTADASTRFLFFKNFLVNKKGLTLRMDTAEQKRREATLQQLRREAIEWIAFK
jgi:hypothetical protein